MLTKAEKYKRLRITVGLLALVVLLLPVAGIRPAGNFLEASLSSEELEEKIKARGEEIEELEAEIAKHSERVNAARAEARTLEFTIQEQEATRDKLQAEINLIQQQLANLQADIDTTIQEIDQTELKVADNRNFLGQILQELHERQNTSMLVRVFAQSHFSAVWQELGDLGQLQDGLVVRLSELANLRNELTAKKAALEEQEAKRQAKKTELTGRQQVAEQIAAEHEYLLGATRSNEAAYQRLLEEKRARREIFKQELAEFEEQLNLDIDEQTIPKSQQGLLAWPLDSIFVTQQFGITSASGRLYQSGSHNGTDFRASVGTPIYSVADATVRGTGDTDQTCPGASWGKWVLLDHPNGLASLYAHLSVISVEPGQSVDSRQLVGYSGNTGYSTGPHLHLTIYAGEGVEITQFPSRACNAVYTMPVADSKAYLDPMKYLPPYQG